MNGGGSYFVAELLTLYFRLNKLIQKIGMQEYLQ